MNSFTLVATGSLARDPELNTQGGTRYARFCLVGHDSAGHDAEGASREVVTRLWFVAFGALGEAIARNARQGDQLILEARVCPDTWTDEQETFRYGHTFVVQGFRFGARGRSTCRSRRALAVKADL